MKVDGKLRWSRKERAMVCPRCIRPMKPWVVEWNECEEFRVVSDTHVFCPNCGLTLEVEVMKEGADGQD